MPFGFPSDSLRFMNFSLNTESTFRFSLQVESKQKGKNRYTKVGARTFEWMTFKESNRSDALLILKYFTMESGSMCATRKSPKKTKNGKSTKGKKKSLGKCARSRIWTSLELEAFARILVYLRMSMKIKGQEPRSSSKKIKPLLSHFKPSNQILFRTIRFAVWIFICGSYGELQVPEVRRATFRGMQIQTSICRKSPCSDRRLSDYLQKTGLTRNVIIEGYLPCSD